MNRKSKKKSMALLLLFAAIIPFSLMVGGFFKRNMDETKLVQRYTSDVRAFWAAEAGIAHATKQISACAQDDECTVSGTISYDGDQDYSYVATVSQVAGNYYKIESSGGCEYSSRTVYMVRKLRDISSGNFNYPVESRGNIFSWGASGIHGGEPQSYADIDFEDRFGLSIDDIVLWRDNYYENVPNNFSTEVYPINGVTYIVDSEQLKISSQQWSGSGVLVVDGDLQITGGTFDGIMIVRGDFQVAGNAEINGIIYVQGQMERGHGSGNPDIYGTVLIECTPYQTTDLRGNINITWDQEEIDDALDYLRFIAPDSVAWWEVGPTQQTGGDDDDDDDDPGQGQDPGSDRPWWWPWWWSWWG